VLAPADAEVVAVVDGIDDNRPGAEANVAEPAGNHIMLDLGGGEYALLAHLQRSSIQVFEGDKVRTGEVVGRCGNSGNNELDRRDRVRIDELVLREGTEDDVRLCATQGPREL
jgi:murein DD-endopeptidase MepM/ murein hydrolase activator NlpD